MAGPFFHTLDTKQTIPTLFAGFSRRWLPAASGITRRQVYLVRADFLTKGNKAAGLN
jgi:hypothetical protein